MDRWHGEHYVPPVSIIDEAELKAILDELARVVAQKSEPPSLPAAPPPQPVEAAAAAEQPPATPGPEKETPSQVLPDRFELPLPEPSKAPAPAPRPTQAPPAAETPSPRPALPEGGAPKDAHQEQLRPIAVVATPAAAADIADLMRSLQEIGRKIAQPIYLRATCVQTVDAETIPATVGIKVQEADVVAVIAMLKGLPDDKRAALLSVLGGKMFHLHLVEPEDIRNRAALIDIMSDLLVIDPQAHSGTFRWEGAQFDDANGRRR
ncbi:MAG: hypothetical protein HY924_11460 [Elusimicrobia bacterium]|nr:hypothetical protein [Elusimicrobiota bacterium]